MKKSLHIFIAFSILTSLFFFSQKVIAAISGADSNLVLYYTFDSGTAADSSGSGINGTVTGATSAAGNVGSGALQFNGTSGFVRMTSTPALSSAMTVSAWIKPNSSSGTIVYRGNNSNSISYELNLSAGRPMYSISTTAGSNPDVSVTSSASAPVGSWTHVLATYNGSALNIYVNGSLAGTAVRTGNLAGTSEMNIGSQSPLGNFFNGAIDDVRVYSRAIDQSEVSELYTLGGGASSGGGGSTLTPVNGACGATTNTCSVGTVANQSTSATQNLWQCTGTNGGTTDSCSSTITQTPPTSHSLTVTKSGTGSGTISGGSISCGSTCTQSNITSGTSITLTASAASGSTFAGWSGACSGTGSCVLSINSNTSVTAAFNTTAVVPAGSDVYFNSNCSVNGNGTSWACASTAGGAGAYNNTTTVGGKTTSCLDPGSYAWKRGVTNWFAGSDTKYAAVCIRNDSGTGRIVLKKPTAANHGTDVGWQGSYETKQAILGGVQTEVPNVTIDGSYRAGPESGYGMKVERSGGNSSLVGTFQNGDPGGGMIIKYLEITNDSFNAGDADAISFFAPGGHLVQYNWIHDISGLCFKSSNGANGKGGFSDSIFEYNVCGRVGRTTDPSWHNELMKDDAASRNVIIRNNLFYDWISTGGIVLGTGGPGDWYIYNNVFTQRTPGLTCGNGVITGLSAGSGYTNVKVFNNTFVNIGSLCAAVFRANFGDFSGPGNEVRNNIFYNTPVDDVCGGGCVKSNNWYAQSSRITPSANEIFGSGNPFINAAAGDFHLASGAGPIDRGIATTLFSTDMDGNSRPSGSTWDIGAYEFVGTGGSSPSTCALTNTCKPGDFDQDGTVGALDYSYLNTYWGTNNATADLNKDGRVNTLDFSILSANWTR